MPFLQLFLRREVCDVGARQVAYTSIHVEVIRRVLIAFINVWKISITEAEIRRLIFVEVIIETASIVVHLACRRKCSAPCPTQRLSMPNVCAIASRLTHCRL
mmetsp:Transcript_40147/g.93953  ORF Transcript_40147/g.93953 Transcript_40147/m.93953 type:complete len:102 (-) Transcript_40147:14-319(-)